MMCLLTVIVSMLGLVSACTLISSRPTTQFALCFTTAGNATVAMGPSQFTLDVQPDETCIQWDDIRDCVAISPEVTVFFTFSNTSVHTAVTGGARKGTVHREVNASPADGFTDVTICNASYHSPMWFDCTSNKKWTVMKAEWCCMQGSGCHQGPAVRAKHSDIISAEPTSSPRPSSSSCASTALCLLFIRFLLVIISACC